MAEKEAVAALLHAKVHAGPSGSTSIAVVDSLLTQQHASHRFILPFSSELVQELIAMLLMTLQALTNAELLAMSSPSALPIRNKFSYYFCCCCCVLLVSFLFLYGAMC